MSLSLYLDELFSVLVQVLDSVTWLGPCLSTRL